MSKSMFFQSCTLSAAAYFAVKTLDYVSTLPPEGGREGYLNQFRVRLANIRSECDRDKWLLAAMMLDNLWVTVFIISIVKNFSSPPLLHAVCAYGSLAMFVGGIVGMTRAHLSKSFSASASRVACFIRPNFFDQFSTV